MMDIQFVIIYLIKDYKFLKNGKTINTNILKKNMVKLMP